MGTDVQERVGRRTPADRIRLPAHRELPPEPESAGVGRGFLREVFEDYPGLLSRDRQESAVNALSELVTNAIIHAATMFRITVTLSADSVVVGVEDGVTDRWPAPRAVEPPEQTVPEGAIGDVEALIAAWSEDLPEDGRGLLLVANLSDAWGIAFSKNTDRKSVYMTFYMSEESVEQRNVPGPRPVAGG